ncbi:hypothetical protein SESBI_27328 [Sesbania bispinosa]|nr:hypothetical protein SESBI_27328 [Sesbania bispinosa]
MTLAKTSAAKVRLEIITELSHFRKFEMKAVSQTPQNVIARFNGGQQQPSSRCCAFFLPPASPPLSTT